MRPTLCVICLLFPAKRYSRMWLCLFLSTFTHLAEQFSFYGSFTSILGMIASRCILRKLALPDFSNLAINPQPASISWYFLGSLATSCWFMNDRVLNLAPSSSFYSSYFEISLNHFRICFLVFPVDVKIWRLFIESEWLIILTYILD